MCYLSSYSLQSRRSFGEGVLSIFSAKILAAIFDFNGSFWSNRKTTVARSHSSWSFFFFAQFYSIMDMSEGMIFLHVDDPGGLLRSFILNSTLFLLASVSFVLLYK